jgi:hypothetical protein
MELFALLALFNVLSVISMMASYQDQAPVPVRVRTSTGSQRAIR